MNGDLLNHIAGFACRYEQLLDQERQALGLTTWDDLRTDWWSGLNFFLNRAFMQGRRDTLSLVFLTATKTALSEILPANINNQDRANRILSWSIEGWFQKCNWDDTANPIRRALDKKYHIRVNGKERWSSTGKTRDREMVLDTFRFICEHPSAEDQVLNITAYAAERIEGREIQGLYRELDGIFQVGPKIARLFLRDLVAVLNLQEYLSIQDYRFLQPTDTWVRQIANKLNIEPGQHELAAALAQVCQDAGVDPIRFNQGAWYLGKHSFDVLLENLERIEP